jgi:hypothetical protein
VTFKLTGIGNIKRLQLNGIMMELVALTTLPTVELKFKQPHLLDGTHQPLSCNRALTFTLELDGLNSRYAFLMIVMFHLKLMFQTLLKPTANGDLLHQDLAFLESNVFAKYLREKSNVSIIFSI